MELGAGSQKTSVIGLPGRQRSLMMSSAMWIQCTNVTEERTDRWTDGQTDRERSTAKTAVTHSVAR